MDKEAKIEKEKTSAMMQFQPEVDHLKIQIEQSKDEITKKNLMIVNEHKHLDDQNARIAQYQVPILYNTYIITCIIKIMPTY